MTKIQNETAYKATMERIEELLPLVDDNTPLSDKNLIELDLLSGLVEEYEDEHYPIKSPSLADIMKLRMYEMGLSQAKLSELLGVSPSRISDYFTGRSEPTLKVAREISKKLNIDANIVLGPEAIVLFGGLAKSGDYIMKPIQKAIDDNILNIYKGKTKLLVSELKDSDAAVLGASALAMK